MKKIVFIGFSIAGALIGAGFATGKEISMFFPVKGVPGILYLIISLAIMFFVSLIFCTKRDSGNRFTKSFDKMFEAVFLIFTGATFSVMLSCGGETLYEFFRLSPAIGSVVTYLICILITFFGLSGVYAFNSVITPVMTICIIIVCLKGLSQEASSMLYPSFQTVSYSGFNLLTLLPFMKNISIKENRKKFIPGAIFGFTSVMLCGIAIKTVIDKFYYLAENAEIPMIRIALLTDKYIGYFYGIIVYFAVLTTAVSCLFCLSEKGNKYMISFPLLLVSFFGFGSLITNVYTFFGYMGTIYIIYILLTVIFFEKRKGDNKYERRFSSDTEYYSGKQGKAYNNRS